MYSYEEWLQKADDIGLCVIENSKFKSQAKGLIYDNCIGLNGEIKTMKEKKCVLAEEIGHYKTGVGNILSQSNGWERKQEQQAKLWSYDNLVGLNGIINSYKKGYNSISEIAEDLEVPETFLLEAVEKYHSKYGLFTTMDNYVIYFEPAFAVAEIIEPLY